MNDFSSKTYFIRKKSIQIIYKILRGILIFGLCFLILQPLLNQISISFMSQTDLFDSTVISIPREPSLNNYQDAMRVMDYVNSLLITLGITFGVALLQIAACTFVAYGFARYNFPFKKTIFGFVILTIIVPPQTILAPLYLNFRFFDIFGIFNLTMGEPLNLLFNPIGYLLMASTGMGLRSGLYIFMLRQHFRNMPKELEEAAYIDGCGKLRTFLQIMLPDAIPMIVSCFLFAFVWQWTDSFFSSLFLGNTNVLSLQLLSLADVFSHQYRMQNLILPSIPLIESIIATGIILVIMPLIAIYMFAQRSFVESIGQSGIKM